MAKISDAQCPMDENHKQAYVDSLTLDSVGDDTVCVVNCPDCKKQYTIGFGRAKVYDEQDLE